MTHKPPVHDRDVNSHWQHELTAHRSWLATVVYARVRDTHAVEEVLQELALAAVKGPRPQEGQSLTGWFYRVAIRQSLLYLRRTARDKNKTHNLATRTIHPDPLQLDPKRWMLACEQRDLVMQALDALSARERELILLKYTEDWSCRQIAERLGVSENTIKQRLLRARQALRRELVRLDKDLERS